MDKDKTINRDIAPKGYRYTSLGVMSEESWDIMSGTAVEPTPAETITITGRDMNKIKFDQLLITFQKELNMLGWVKEYSGYEFGTFKAIFAKKDVI